MWADGASGCLARQLKALIDAKQCTKLTVFTHSNGGNVMRWIMSNPTANPDFQAVMNVLYRVNALAPTSAGTPLANAVTTGSVFEVALGWLIGYDSDAVWMQRTDWMASYNANNLFGTAGRPALSKPFRYVGGTDVETNPTDIDSWCGGYDTNVGLEITQSWLNSCSDGFINCTSQSAAGTKFYWDYERTNNPNKICVLGIGDCGSWEPLSHGQSRRDCFGHAEALRNEGYY
jgi:hypothetical protein